MNAMHWTIWALIALVAAAQGLFFSVVLFVKQENRLPNRLIGILLLLLAFTLLEWSLWWTQGIEQAPALKGASVGIPWLYGPLMYLFYRAVFERRPMGARATVHFLPFVAVVFFMLPFYLRFFENLTPYLNWIPPLTRQPWFFLLVFAQMIAYGIGVGWRFRRFFRENEELRKWHRWLLTAYWGIVFTYVFYRLLPFFGLTAEEWKYLIAASLTVFIYLAAWLGYVEPRVFAGMPLQAAVTAVKYRHSSLRNGQSAALFERMINLVEQEALYRDSRLTLDGLAGRLGEQRHHISQAINEQSGKSFSEWINQYRVEEARRLLASTTKKELNVIEVAYETGFSSKNMFNLVFKRHTGQTPTEYREAQRKKVNPTGLA